jgi:hypothetical protein
LPDVQNPKAGAENPVTAELKSEPDPEPQVQADAKTGGTFRILKGFWD